MAEVQLIMTKTPATQHANLYSLGRVPLPRDARSQDADMLSLAWDASSMLVKDSSRSAKGSTVRASACACGCSCGSSDGAAGLRQHRQSTDS